MTIRLTTVVLLILHGVCHATNIVVNGGFETGDFTAWMLSGTIVDTFVGTDQPHSGSSAATVGAYPTDVFLTQILPTVAGASYTLSYWLQNEGGTPNDFSVSWNGATLPGSM